MARRLISESGLTVGRLSLDEIAWDDGVERRPLEESKALLFRFIQAHENWVIEGCYSDLVEAALPFSSELRFLNPGVETCIRHCLSRPWEPEKFSSPAEQHALLRQLVEWVRTYESRTDEYGLSRHRELYNGYSGTKREYTNVADYDDW